MTSRCICHPSQTIHTCCLLIYSISTTLAGVHGYRSSVGPCGQGYVQLTQLVTADTCFCPRLALNFFGLEFFPLVFQPHPSTVTMHLIFNSLSYSLHDQLIAAAHAQSTRLLQSPSHAHLQPTAAKIQHRPCNRRRANVDSSTHSSAGATLISRCSQPTDATDLDAAQEARKTYGKRECSTSKPLPRIALLRPALFVFSAQVLSLLD